MCDLYIHVIENETIIEIVRGAFAKNLTVSLFIAFFTLLLLQSCDWQYQ